MCAGGLPGASDGAGYRWSWLRRSYARGDAGRLVKQQKGPRRSGIRAARIRRGYRMMESYQLLRARRNDSLPSRSQLKLFDAGAVVAPAAKVRTTRPAAAEPSPPTCAPPAEPEQTLDEWVLDMIARICAADPDGICGLSSAQIAEMIGMGETAQAVTAARRRLVSDGVLMIEREAGYPPMVAMAHWPSLPECDRGPMPHQDRANRLASQAQRILRDIGQLCRLLMEDGEEDEASRLAGAAEHIADALRELGSSREAGR